jgi:hypothetical protein
MNSYASFQIFNPKQMLNEIALKELAADALVN